MVKSYHVRSKKKELKMIGKTILSRKNIENSHVFITMLSYYLTLVSMLPQNT
jgi:hypothetical protein